MSVYTTLDVRNNAFPCQGPRTVPVTLDFGSAQSFDVDLTQLVQNGKLEEVQGLFIDNSASSSELNITCAVTNQVIHFPAGSQGYLPTLTQSPKYKMECLDAGAIVKIQVLNFPMPAYIWSAGANAVNQVSVVNSPLSVSQNEPVKIHIPNPDLGATKSLSVSTTSANVAVIAGDVLRVYNPLSEVVFVKPGNNAPQTASAADVPILPGKSVDFAGVGYDNLAAITLSSTGDIYIATFNYS